MSTNLPAGLLDPVTGPLAERAHPELAAALRPRIESILDEWTKLLRQHLPPANDASFETLVDHVPEILNGMVDALASDDPAEVRLLIERSPSQGIQRFQMHYDVRDLATEDRMLRRVIFEQVDRGLGRRTTREEDAALNWAIDLMAQQAMIAFVNYQNERLRDAAEAELKYLSFLSHDLSGNLGNVTLWLTILRQRLAAASGFAEEVSTLDTAQQTIIDTVDGMTRLLQAERSGTVTEALCREQ